MKISNSIKYIGVNDHEVDLFEGQYVVPNGMAYNSYVILDEKIAVLDTVDERFAKEWMANLLKELDGKKPEFLIVQHMEPDHSGSIMHFVKEFPDAKIVASKLAFSMMKNFFGNDFADKQLIASDGSKLDLGSHMLSFIEICCIAIGIIIIQFLPTIHKIVLEKE